LPLFKEVFEKYPRSQFAPETIYYREVGRYLNSDEVDDSKKTGSCCSVSTRKAPEVRAPK
jgi:hypothetical protein